MTYDNGKSLIYTETYVALLLVLINIAKRMKCISLATRFTRAMIFFKDKNVFDFAIKNRCGNM